MILKSKPNPPLAISQPSSADGAGLALAFGTTRSMNEGASVVDLGKPSFPVAAAVALTLSWHTPDPQDVYGATIIDREEQSNESFN